MQARHSRQRAFRFGLAIRIIHPLPTSVNAVASGGLALLARQGRLNTWSLVHLILAMLAIQAAIGIVNDLRDFELDALTKPAKPLIQGVIGVRTAQLAAAVSIALSVLLATGFGLAAWTLAMGGLASGLVYDLWLKRTIASALPYLIGLPLLPLWVWTAVGRFQPALLALIPFGVMIGLALHLANSLPDFEDDGRAGARGLVHRLGKRRAIQVCWATYGLTLAFVALSRTAVSYRGYLLLPGMTIASLALVVSIAAYQVNPSRASLQVGWTLLLLGSAILAVGWLGSLPPA
ncbi:MAG: UbiA family prenyltransferase [Dehalococcoidia bacterium]